MAAALLCLAATFPGLLKAQTAESLGKVRRLAVDWPETERGSAARDRMVQKLKASGAVEVVANGAPADGVLHGKVTLWVSGYVSTSPRSKAAERPVYRGYASAEVTGKGGQTLWSYLVTPRSEGWKSISEDLGEQLAKALLSALAKKESKESADVATPAGNAAKAATVQLRGAGATFPGPLYQKWFESFEQVRPEIAIEYGAVGSEEGILRLARGVTDFAASDMPLSEEQRNAPGKKVLQVATVLGAVVPIYNVKGTGETLSFTGEVLAGIFLGKIRRWNAPEIQAINKRVHLPDVEIAVIHRSDGSGTTFAWTDYLAKVSAEWKSTIGTGTTVNWPAGKGAEHNDGVAEAVYRTPNSIGYVELLYALQHELEYGAVRNGSGEFVKADLDSVTAAGKTAVLPESAGFGVSITNASGRHSYPIATFTWFLVPEDGAAEKQAALRDLLRWMLTSGQKQCEGLGYSPLPAELANRELAVVAGMK